MLYKIIFLTLLLVSLPTVANTVSMAEDSTSAQVNCRNSWSCFIKAAKTCTPAKVRKNIISGSYSDLSNLRVKHSYDIVMSGLQEGQCRFTMQAVSLKRLVTLKKMFELNNKYIEQKAQELAIEGIEHDPFPTLTLEDFKKQMEELDSIVANSSFMKRFYCSGSTETTYSFFKKYKKETSKAQLFSSSALSISDLSIMYMEGDIFCSVNQALLENVP